MSERKEQYDLRILLDNVEFTISRSLADLKEQIDDAKRQIAVARTDVADLYRIMNSITESLAKRAGADKRV